jgi:hypothetical protein
MTAPAAASCTTSFSFASRPLRSSMSPTAAIIAAATKIPVFEPIPGRGSNPASLAVNMVRKNASTIATPPRRGFGTS